MRQIKFRAWDNKKKEWLLGYELPNLGGFSLYGEVILLGEYSSCVDQFLFERNGYKKEDLIIMQYIGLKDKNGKEIYEGDIIDFAGLKPIEIVWRDAGFKSKLIPYEHSEPIILTQEGFTLFAKVIGNIYDKPTKWGIV